MDNIQERADRIGNEINGGAKDLASKFSQIKDKASQAGQQAFDAAKSVAEEVKNDGKQVADQICSQSSKSIDNIREYVTHNPFRSVAAAIGLGLIVGYMRRKS
jgi:ElaB/YqjD/DUF883 family membrane-anchored ribosome-binding protein